LIPLPQIEDKMNFKLLKKLYSIHSHSGSEKHITSFISKWITNNVPGAIVELDARTGNLYIVKGQAETYPCIVAHLDQVQKLHPNDFVAIETNDIIFGYSAQKRSLCGLGADDKNGIWIALMCLQKFDTLKIAFFVQEEIGCKGSSNALMEFFDNCRFVIEPDRRGNSDLITDISGSICSDEFIDAIQPVKYGYKPTSGMMTDVEQLKENGLEISCINLSCGYYDPHTDHEFTVKKDLLKCLNFIEHIITDIKTPFPHEPEFTYYGRGCSLGWWDEYDTLYECCEHMLTLDPTATPSDIYDAWHSTFPHMTKDDFAMVYDDCLYEIESEKFKKKDETD